MVQRLAWLALAGALGTLARYGLAGLAHRLGSASFPWGTFSVNALGCLVAGFLWSLFESRWTGSGQVRVIVLIGFMGAFTTFSAFMLETAEFVRDAEWLAAAGNVLLQNGTGFIAILAGVSLGRLV